MVGDKDSDGFYHGESGGLSGYVPSNMVAEIPVDDEYLKHLLMQQGFLPVDHSGTHPQFVQYVWLYHTSRTCSDPLHTTVHCLVAH